MARPDRVLRRHLRQRFVVTTHQGATWRALIVDADERIVLLADVEAVNPDGSFTKADGQIFLPRADIAYIQLV